MFALVKNRWIFFSLLQNCSKTNGFCVFGSRGVFFSTKFQQVFQQGFQRAVFGDFFELVEFFFHRRLVESMVDFFSPARWRW